MSCSLSLLYIVVSHLLWFFHNKLFITLRENDKVKPRASLKVTGLMALEDTIADGR